MSPRPNSIRQRLGFGVWRANQQSEGYLFLLPSLLGFLTFVVVPVISSLALSFYRWDLLTSPEFVGLANYRQLVETDPLFGQVLYNTFYYMLIIAPIQLVLGFILAVALDTGIRGLPFYRLIYFMPVVTNIVAAAIVFQFLLNRDIGILSAWIWQLAEWLLTQEFVTSSESWTTFVKTYIRPPDWLNDSRWAKPGVVLLTVWKNVGFTMVIYLAGLQSISQTLYDAAKVDGATVWQRLRHITIPLISPTTFFLLIIQMLGAFQLFVEPFVLTTNTQGDIQKASVSMVIYIYQNAFDFQRMGKASAIAWVLFAIVLVVTLIQNRLQRHWVYYEIE